MIGSERTLRSIMTASWDMSSSLSSSLQGLGRGELCLVASVSASGDASVSIGGPPCWVISSARPGDLPKSLLLLLLRIAFFAWAHGPEDAERLAALPDPTSF